MEAGDSSASKAADGSTAAGRTTPGWNGVAGQNTDDVSRLARAALQGTALFAGSTGGAGQGASGTDAAAAAAGNLLDPLGAHQLTPDQLAAMLSTGGYTATALGSLGGAGLQTAENAAALNALLLGGGLNLNQLAAQNLQLAGLGAADLSALGALVGGDAGEVEDQAGGSKAAGINVASNKQLSSRFRGVCWNKKNKRWQAAINSSGKYLYLGSFTNEDEAARQFDRAAIKLRGKKAKLNFEYHDYVDENGDLLDEIILPQGATGNKDDPSRGSTGGARRGSKSAGADGGLGLGIDAELMNQAALAALMQQGAWQGMARSGKTAVVAAPLALEKEQVSVLLPPGCSLEYVVPVQDAGASSGGGNGSSGKSLFGVVYKEGGSGMYGAGVWTGYMFKAFGLYSSDGEAAQTARCAGELLSEDRDLRVSGGVANQQSMGLMAAPAGLLATPAAAAAFPQDALALAGLAAGLGGARGAGANGAAGVTGLLGMGPGLVGAAGMGGLANVSLAQAAQLAQQAAAEQGLPMSYPPLSVALPVVTSALQLLPAGADGTTDAAAAAAAAAGLDAATAAAKASNEAEMQQLMQQLMQQQQQPQLGAAQQQLVGGDGFLKLANFEMMHLRQQMLDQQQQGLGAGAAEADLQQQQQGQVLGSIPGLDTGVKRPLEGDTTGVAGTDAAAAAGVNGGLPVDMLTQPGAAAAAAATMAVGGAAGDEHAAKRVKTEEGSVADPAAAAAAAATAPLPGAMMGPAAGVVGGGMAQMDLQDALKMMQQMQQQQQQAPAQE